MKIQRIDGDWDKVSTKKALVQLLSSYRGILSDSVYKYLNSLIELEFSAVRDYISDNDRAALSDLEVYRKIVIYNIYKRALNLFKENDPGLKISGNNDGIEGLKVYASLDNRNFKLFDFDYGREQNGFNVRIPKIYRTTNIGNITLFQSIGSPEKREEEMNRVLAILEVLYNQRNPYPVHPHTYGGPDSQWAFDHSNKVEVYERRFEELDSKKGLTDADKREIEITQKYFDLILEDFGLTDEDFEDAPSLHFNGAITGSQKTLVKRMPNLNIKKSIKYIF